MADLSIDYQATSDSYLDLVFQNGDLCLTNDANATGTHAVLQNIQQAVRAYRGEWFLNLPDGVPYFQEVFRKGTSAAEREAILKSAVLEAPGVLRIDSFVVTTNTATRTMQLQFAAATTQGAIATSIDIEFPGGARP